MFNFESLYLIALMSYFRCASAASFLLCNSKLLLPCSALLLAWLLPVAVTFAWYRYLLRVAGCRFCFVFLVLASCLQALRARDGSGRVGSVGSVGTPATVSFLGDGKCRQAETDELKTNAPLLIISLHFTSINQSES